MASPRTLALSMAKMLWPSWLWSNLWLDLRALGVFRCAFGAASLVEVMELMTFRAFLDENGVCPQAKISSGTMFDLYLACKSPESVFLLLLLQLLAVLCFMLGFWTRLSGFVCWVFAMSQHHRLSNCVEYGGDRLRSHLFFWSLFQPLGLVWSIDAYLQSGKASEADVRATEWIPWCFCPGAIEELPHPKKEKPPRNTAAPLSAFLVLLQLASMYEYTASTKVGESWQSGDAVLQTLHLTQYAREPVASILASFPSICRLFTHATLYIEKYGWLLAFLPFQLSRLLAFGMFFGLHLGLNLSLRVGGFQLFVLSAWCVALPRCLLDFLEAQLHRFWPRGAQLLVISQTPVGPSAAKRAMRLGCVTAFNLLGFSLIFLAMAEGCLHRDHSQCAMAPLLRDFGAQRLLTKLDLLQRYNMFSPDPPRKALRVQLYGVLASSKCQVGVQEFWKHCRVVELWSDRGFPSGATKMSLQTWGNLSAPVRQPVDFATNRWRKLVEKNEKSKGLGGYMCSQWASHSPSQQLLGLWLVRASLEWPKVKESFTGEMKYWCSSHAKELMQKLPPQPWLD